MTMTMTMTMTNFTRQRGTTIVGLMVGMLVSTIGILASLSLYKTLLSVAAEAKTDALHDGQLTTSLLAIQLRVQNAGFGLEGNSTNIVIYEDASEKQLLWRYKIDNVVTCEGLKRHKVAGTYGDKTVLEYMHAANGCDENNALNSMGWQGVTRLSAFDPTVTSVVDFSLAAQQCSPYGLSDAGDFYVLTLSGKSAAHINGAQVGGNLVDETSLELCLLNIRSA